MDLQLLIVWYLKLPYETKELFPFHIEFTFRENPEFANYRVDGKFQGLD